MKNNYLDTWYQSLLSLLVNENLSTSKLDRTGTGTRSAFGIQFRHNMSDGFPLLTTKKMAWKSIVTELLWFLKGDTNIKFLVDNGCHVWDGDAYKNYCNAHPDAEKTFQYEGSTIDVRKMTQEEFINKIKADNEFAKKWGELGPIYGKQWRHWTNRAQYLESRKIVVDTYTDQIANLINELKTNPDSRRLMVSAWNVGELDQMVLPPCHYGFQMYTRELSFDERHLLYCKSFEGTNDNHKGSSNIEQMTEYHNNRNIPKRAISLMWNQRSVDTFLGLPFNIASYGLLLEIIAKEVNMVPDQLIGNLGDVHLYNNHIEQAKEQIDRNSFDLPKINFNSEWWDKPFFEAVKSDNFCKCLLEEDIQLYDYQSHPSIKAPLSN